MGAEISVVAGRYNGWACQTLENGPVKLVLVPQVGGRIMAIRWRGHDLSFRQPELEGQVIDVAGVGDLATRKREPGFPLWGGEKTWLAPQAHWQEGSPFLDFERRGRGRGWMLDVSDVSGLGLVGDHKQVPVFPD